MKKIIIGLSVIFFFVKTFSQQKNFEGIITYRVEAKSKTELISDRVIRNILAMGNEMIVFIKNGNYKQISNGFIGYYVPKDQQVYIKYNNIDTLYYVEYSFDSTTVKKIMKSDEKKIIANFECKTITIEASDAIRKYYYTPALYMNPEYDKNNSIGKFNVFMKETSSLYLASSEERKEYSLSLTGVRVQQTEIPDSVFELPKLPIKKFVLDELITPPEFTRPGGWENYLVKSIDREVGSKYIKLRKGEDSASQKVIVKFLVNEYGRVVFAEVENKKEVHPKLAEEALRVVNASPLWKPAVIYNSEKTIFWLRAPITFLVTKK